MPLIFSPERARIYRITHRDNIPWIAHNGLHCRNSNFTDPNFVQIGNPELIEKRRTRQVPVTPGGTLGDYVPFYFTPYSVMMFNVITGYNGIRRREKREIAIIVSSLHTLRDKGVAALFTDRHASLEAAQYYDELGGLPNLDWAIWNRRDFKGDPEDLEKKDRYQAEALIHRHLPVDGILGIVCYSPEIATELRQAIGKTNNHIKMAAQPKWYF